MNECKLGTEMCSKDALPLPLAVHLAAAPRRAGVSLGWQAAHGARRSPHPSPARGPARVLRVSARAGEAARPERAARRSSSFAQLLVPAGRSHPHLDRRAAFHECRVPSMSALSDV